MWSWEPSKPQLTGPWRAHSTFLETSHSITNVRNNICDGPGLHRFSEALRLYAQLRLLCRAHQIECASPTALLACSGQEHGRALGSDRHSDILRIGLGVSRCTTARELLRRGDQQAAEVPDQQLCAPCTYHRANLQVPLAGGTVLQMDQATPAHQGLLRDQRECSEDPDLDRGVGLRAGGDRT